ncbi:hypothetical protein ABG067_005559 [Albugo candida]
MKGGFFKTRIPAMIGIFQANYHHVGAVYADMILPTSSIQFRGLEVLITPPLTFSDAGDLVKAPDSKVYTVSLILQSLNSNEENELRNFDGKGKRGGVIAVLREKTRSYLDRLELIFANQKYYVAWKLNWNNMQTWIKQNKLHVSPTSNLINVDAYIRDHKGIYFFTWDTEDKPRLHVEHAALEIHPHSIFAKPISDKVLEKGNVEFMGTRFDNIGLEMQLFASEAIKVPTHGFEHFKQALEKYGVVEEKDFLRVGCAMLNYIDGNSIYTLSFSKEIVDTQILFIKPNQYIKTIDKTSGQCALLIQDSKSRNLVLGASFLKSNNVQIDTQRGFEYKFFCQQVTPKPLLSNDQVDPTCDFIHQDRGQQFYDSILNSR